MKKTAFEVIAIILLVVLIFVSGCITPKENIEEKVNETDGIQEEVQEEIEEEPEEEKEIEQIKVGDIEISSADGSFITANDIPIGCQAWVSYSFNNTGTVPIHPVIDVYVLRADGSIEDQEDPIDHEDYLDQNPNIKYIFKPKESFSTATLVLVGFDLPYPKEEEIRQFTVKMELRDKGDSNILDTATSEIIFNQK